MDNDHDLVIKTIKGDMEAYNELVKSVYPMVLQNCRRILFYSPSHVEDAAQVFFIKLPKLLEDKFDFTSKASTFIYSASCFSCYNYRRGIENSLSNEMEFCDSDLLPWLEVEDSETVAPEIMDRKRFWNSILDIVEGLSSDLWLVFHLYCYGYTHKEIAEQLGISNAKSRKRLFKVNELLRKELKCDFLKLFEDL